MLGKFNWKKFFSISKKALIYVLVFVIGLNIFLFAFPQKIKASSSNFLQADTEMATRDVTITKTEVDKNNKRVIITIDWKQPIGGYEIYWKDILFSGIISASEGAHLKFSKYSPWMLDYQSNKSTSMVPHKNIDLNKIETTQAQFAFSIPENNTVKYLINIQSIYDMKNWAQCSTDFGYICNEKYDIKETYKNDINKQKAAQAARNMCKKLGGNMHYPAVDSTSPLTISIDKEGNVNKILTETDHQPSIEGNAQWDENSKSYKIQLSWQKNPKALEPDGTEYKYKLLYKYRNLWAGKTQGSMTSYTDDIKQDLIKNEGNKLTISYAVFAYYSTLANRSESLSKTITFTLELDKNGNPINKNPKSILSDPPNSADVNNAIDIGNQGPKNEGSECETSQCKKYTSDALKEYACRAACMVLEAMENTLAWVINFFIDAITGVKGNYTGIADSTANTSKNNTTNNNSNTNPTPAPTSASTPVVHEGDLENLPTISPGGEPIE